MTANTADPAPRRRSAFVVVWRIHRWIGLGFAAVLIVVSVSGGLLVMHPELERVIERDRHVIKPPADPATAARAEPEAVLRQAIELAPPGFRPLRVQPGESADRTDKYVFISDDGANRRWSAFVNPYTGELVWHGHDESLLRPWLLHLHEKLHLGATGFVIVGVASVALLLLGFTGLWITRDRWRLLWRNPFRRRAAGARVLFADLHKWFGLASLYFTLVLGGTGLWFAILIVPGVLKGDAREPLSPPFDFSRLTSVSAALATTRQTFPDAEIARVIFPWRDDVGLQIRLLHRDAPIWAKFNRIDFDPITGEVRQVRRASDASAKAKLESILGPLHFGYYGAAWVKWLYVLGGFSPALLSVTGLVIWWRRLRRPITSCN
jgi:uncharacterized iron-regulated membrane protein